MKSTRVMPDIKKTTESESQQDSSLASPAEPLQLPGREISFWQNLDTLLQEILDEEPQAEMNPAHAQEPSFKIRK